MVWGKGLKYDSFLLTSRWAYNRRGLLRFCILQLEGGGGDEGGLKLSSSLQNPRTDLLSVKAVSQ